METISKNQSKLDTNCRFPTLCFFYVICFFPIIKLCMLLVFFPIFSNLLFSNFSFFFHLHLYMYWPSTLILMTYILLQPFMATSVCSHKTNGKSDSQFAGDFISGFSSAKEEHLLNLVLVKRTSVNQTPTVGNFTNFPLFTF